MFDFDILLCVTIYGLSSINLVQDLKCAKCGFDLVVCEDMICLICLKHNKPSSKCGQCALNMIMLVECLKLDRSGSRR